MPAIGFSVYIQEVLPIGGEVLRTDFISIKKCNSATTNNIKKGGSIYFPSLYILICTYDEGQQVFCLGYWIFQDSLV